MASVTFYGGVGTVTGSKYLLEHNGRRVLVDCGLFQGLKELRNLNWQDPPFDAAEIDAVLITHAHIDHSGWLPRLVKMGFRGPIITSRATAQLLTVLLPDSARLQEEEADYRNRHNLTIHTPALPLYDEDDARAALELIEPVANDGVSRQVCDGVAASSRGAGHILGASTILVELKDARPDGSSIRFLFSGDLGRRHQPILKDPEPPAACDYLMCESTYGDRSHGEEDPKSALAAVINRAVERKGPVLIPAFAVGRTQEILYMLRELEREGRIPVLPVVVDSPMAAEATRIYSRLKEEHDPEYLAIIASNDHPLRTGSMKTTSTRDESKQLNNMKGPRIIISASGMLSGGRVLHHAMRVLPDRHATLVFVGYQAAGTRGRRIIEGADEVKVMKNWVPVRCHIERIETYSAHADWRDVLLWLAGLPEPPKVVFTTHGEPAAANAMANHIRRAFGWQVMVPEYGQTVDLT
jgi:metallo-beta-lactamase family protein